MAAGLIYALDLGVNIGIAEGNVDEARPDSCAFALKLAEEGPEVALAALLNQLTWDWEAVRPALVAVEAPLHLGGFAKLGNAEATVRLQYGLHAIVQAVAVKFQTRLVAERSDTIRKHFLGVGRIGTRAETKTAVVKRCHMLGYLPKDCLDDNRADACAVWDWARHTHFRRPLLEAGRVLEFRR
jgi:hypothetical protein